MRPNLVAVLLAGQAALVLAAGVAHAAEGLPRSQPEAQGVRSLELLKLVEALDTKIDGMHSVMVVRHGHVIAEGWWTPYDAASRHALYSLSKSFTSTAVGLAVGEGKLQVSDAVLKFFPDDAPASPENNLKAMRVHDLLRMSAGHVAEVPLSPTLTTPWTRAFLAHPVPFKPGTHFLYNTPATYMLSAIVQKVTGQTVLDYLRPRLFDPLGIEGPTWGTSPQGVSLGGYGLSVRTEDIAKFGQLYLQKGRWHGKQLVPEAWVDAATARQTSNGSNPDSDWEQGYGYQFWRCRHGAFRGDGAFGQYCVVMPAQDTVVAITSGVKDMQAVLNVLWDHLLPALQPNTLTGDDAGSSALKARLAALTLSTQKGAASSPTAAKVAGKTYALPDNPRRIEAVGLEPGGDGESATLVLTTGGKTHRVACGRDGWKRGRVDLGGGGETAVAASGAWTDDHTFVAKFCLYETPFVATLRLGFADDHVTLDTDANVGFGPTKAPQLTGRPK